MDYAGTTLVRSCRGHGNHSQVRIGEVKPFAGMHVELPERRESRLDVVGLVLVGGQVIEIFREASE